MKFIYLKKIIYIGFIYSNLLLGQKNYILKIYFDKDKSEISFQNDLKIDSILKLIKYPENYFIKLDAHTDSDGTDIYNDNLANKRAESVKNKLLNFNFNIEQIEISNFGEHYPVIDNSNEINKQLNRRVKIIFIMTQGKIRIKGKIYSNEDNIPIKKAKMLIKTEKKIDTVYTNNFGEYDIWVPKSNPSYYLVSSIKNHFYHYEKIDTKSLNDNQLELNIELKKLNKGVLINIPLFNFIEDKTILIKESEPNLILLLEVMKKNPELKIEIHGHINKQNTGPVSKDSYLYKLSYNRAKVIYDYLVSNGINSNRMKIKAFGNWQMLYPNTLDKKLQDLNRRVEIFILEN